MILRCAVCCSYRSESPLFRRGQTGIEEGFQKIHLTNAFSSCILASKFRQVYAVNERKSEVQSLREPVDGENRCDVSVIYHS